MAPIIAALLPTLGKIVGNLFPDPAEKAKVEAEMMKQLLTHQAEIENAAGKIIQTEAASSHWLAANWRPLTMITFVALIVARWFGWAAPELKPEEYLKLWDIVELGLGGYIIGRTVEKGYPLIGQALSKGK